MAGRVAPITIAVLSAVGLARGQTYTAQVIYALNPPSGFSAPFPANTPAASAGGQVIGSATASSDHAMLWAPGIGGVDLGANIPAGTTKSYAAATDGAQQGGYAEGSTGGYSDQALLWSSTSSSVVDLNPTQLPGITASEVQGLCPGQQVGYAAGPGTSNRNQAMLWSGSAMSAVDLNPDGLGINNSAATATDMNQQVGYGVGPGTSGQIHALLWSSTASSAVDLNPSAMGFSTSQALGVCDGQQVGRGSVPAGSTHALLWNSSAGSAIDLNPSVTLGIQQSEADGTNGTTQVGYGSGFSTLYQNHALLWAGTANSAMDLQMLLPSAGTWTSSYASSIDASGNVFGVAKGSFNSVSGYFAIEWSPSTTTALTDIGRGSEVLAGASLGDVTMQVRSGFNSGDWNGSTGITSSAAASDPSHLTAVGVIQNNQGGSPIYSSSNLFEGTAPGPNDVLVKFTYYGDSNLDGTVDSSDYTRIDAAYLADSSSSNSLTGWFNGDFNYDGVINGSDYTLIDNAFNTQGAQLTAALATAQIAAGSVSTAIPEPLASSLLLAGSMLELLTRRRNGQLSKEPPAKRVRIGYTPNRRGR